MAEGAYPSQSQAIVAYYGNDGDKRRIEVKLKERRKARLAAHMAEVAARHAEVWPAWSNDDGMDFRFEVRIPVPDGGEALAVTVDLGGKGRPGQGLSCNAVACAAAATDIVVPWHGGFYGALEALGVAHQAVDGVLADRWPDCDAVRALGRSLHAAWLDAGVQGHPGLAARAEAHEAARLSAAGLDRLRGMVGDDGGRIAACFADFPLELVRTALVGGMDTARRSVLAALAPFAGRDLAAMDPDVVAGYVGRPLELLGPLLETRGVGPGRPVTASDAAWLDAVVGRRAVTPAPDRVLATLLRLRGAVDQHRCSTDADAAGLVALLAAAGEYRDGVVADLLLQRLGTGPDAALGYGAAATGLRDAWDGDLASAVGAVTLGVEAWCADVAADLLVPGVVSDVAMAAGDPKRAQRFVAGAFVTARWLGLLEEAARDMVLGGRTMGALALAVRRRGCPSAADVPFRLFGSRMSEAVAGLSSPLAGAGGLDAAWERQGPHLVPRWRVGGRAAWADRVREAFRDAGAGGPTTIGLFRRGVRTLVALGEAGTPGEGRDPTTRLSGGLLRRSGA